jgi:hypothetical protein
MATHDYVIDNQSAPNFRTDLNSALAAIVSTNSNATDPSVTFANMLWYDTANKQIKKRNEANSAWITLGTVDEANSKFTPNAAITTNEISAATLVTSTDTIASNNNDTTIPTSAAVKAYADSVSAASEIGVNQTWQTVTRTNNTSYQNLTGKPIVFKFRATTSNGSIEVSQNNSTWLQIQQSDASSGTLEEFNAIIPLNYYYRGNAIGDFVVELR